MFHGFGAAAYASGRRRGTGDKAALVFAARCSDSAAALHALLAREARQPAPRHVQRRLAQRASAAAAVVARLVARCLLPQVRDDALGAQQVAARELVQRRRRAIVAAALHQTHPIVEHLALHTQASVF
jgi:hypothetical protein